jgi:hypothetical protein
LCVHVCWHWHSLPHGARDRLLWSLASAFGLGSAAVIIRVCLLLWRCCMSQCPQHPKKVTPLLAAVTAFGCLNPLNYEWGYQKTSPRMGIDPHLKNYSGGRVRHCQPAPTSKQSHACWHWCFLACMNPKTALGVLGPGGGPATVAVTARETSAGCRFPPPTRTQ